MGQGFGGVVPRDDGRRDELGVQATVGDKVEHRRNHCAGIHPAGAEHDAARCTSRAMAALGRRSRSRLTCTCLRVRWIGSHSADRPHRPCDRPLSDTCPVQPHRADGRRPRHRAASATESRCRRCRRTSTCSLPSATAIATAYNATSPAPPTTSTGLPGRSRNGPPRRATRRAHCRTRSRLTAGSRPAGQRHQHRVGIRNAHDVAERAAPLPARNRRHPERGTRTRGRTAAGESAPAPFAGAAADLERHDHAIAAMRDRDVRRHVEDVGDELVSECERSRQRCASQDDWVSRSHVATAIGRTSASPRRKAPASERLPTPSGRARGT